MAEALTHAQTTALWVASFFDELVRCGVRAAVVSPGSRSTPLAMAAFELSCRRPDDLRVYVDVDERGAAFLGLGMAKASGRPVALICTSGTATANYYPAVIEAETSRVPLIVLTGDRPPRLQGLGAPQTTDQLKLYGDHVRSFRAMPLPAADERSIAFARQAAREAFIAATGARPSFGRPGDVQVASRACEAMAGPVHLNFPFDEPLKPEFGAADRWVAASAASAPNDAEAGGAAAVEPPAGDGAAAAGDTGAAPGAAVVAAGASADAFSFGRLPIAFVVHVPRPALANADAELLAAVLADKRVLVLAGEGTCSTLAEAHEVAAWARRCGYPLLADPLSGLRAVDAPQVVDAYDAAFGQADCPLPDAVIRFGRYPVSKRATTQLAAARPLNVVVDAGETRDFNAATDRFVAMAPLDFVRSFDPSALAARDCGSAPSEAQRAFFDAWISLNDRTRVRLAAAASVAAGTVSEEPATDAAPSEGPVTDDADRTELFEGALIAAVLDEAPASSCLFVANSMAVRNLDTFQRRGRGPRCVMANRGQNGIDGTLSTAIGAAQLFEQTTLITGDLTLQHDLNALALQHELLRNQPGTPPTLVVVLLNNDGGAIFDMLPQASDDPYFERLFLTPQGVDFEHAALAFGVPYRRAASLEEFSRLYRMRLRVPGISLIEARVPLRGLKERLGGYWK